MKKIIMVLVSGVIYTSLITTNATAQGSNDFSLDVSKNANSSLFSESYKTAAGNAIAPADKTAIKELKANLRAAKANLKVTNHLEKNFKNVSDLKVGSEEKAIVATFKMNDKSSRVVYDKKGNWLYSIITFNEDQIPRDIRSLIEANYKGFNISMAQEISQGDVTLYKVFLEDCGSLKNILVYNGEITDYENFTKSR